MPSNVKVISGEVVYRLIDELGKWHTSVPGATSPAARGVILKLPPVNALTVSAKVVAPPKMVSVFFFPTS